MIDEITPWFWHFRKKKFYSQEVTWLMHRTLEVQSLRLGVLEKNQIAVYPAHISSSKNDAVKEL